MSKCIVYHRLRLDDEVYVFLFGRFCLHLRHWLQKWQWHEGVDSVDSVDSVDGKCFGWPCWTTVDRVCCPASKTCFGNAAAMLWKHLETELCFFSLLNCNTQIRTPTRGLRKPLLPSKTAYARVTFQEVPTRLPTRKMLQRSLYLTWCGHNSGSEEEYKELEDDDSLGDLWKEGGSLIKSGALCHDVIGNHDELMETLEKWNCKTLMGYGPQFDLGPPHFLREGLRGAYAKIRTENCCSKLGTCNFLKKLWFFNLPFLPAKHMNHTIQFAFKIIVSQKNKSSRSETNNLEHLNKRLRETAYAASPTLSYVYAYAKPTHQAE